MGRRAPMRPWYVISPVFPYTEVILDDGTGPTYEECDVVEVQAHTKREALVLGVKEMRKQRLPWITQYCEGSPFAGVKVELAACHHGTWEDRCERCELEFKAEDAVIAAIQEARKRG